MNVLRSRFSVTLIINFLFIAAVSLGTASCLNYQFTRRDLIRQTQVNLDNESRELALLIGEILLEHASRLEALSIERSVQQSLLSRPQSEESASRSRSSVSDAQFTDVLTEFAALFPQYSDLRVTDQNGDLVTATSSVENDNYRNQAWWQAAWNNGQGNIFIGNPSFDKRRQIHVSRIAVPIYLDGKAIGVLHSFYQLDRALSKALDSVVFESGGGRLYLSAERYLGENQIEEGAPVLNELLVHPPRRPIVYSGQRAFVSVTPVQTVSDARSFEERQIDQAIANLNWYILVYQSAQEALQPLTTSARIALATAAGAFLLAVVLSSILARLVSHPVQVLIGTAQKVRADSIDSEDLQHLHQIAEKGDDMAKLATVFRDMALVITEREKSLSDEIASLQAQVEAGSQQASGLELAYYEALRKKSAWLRQQSTSQSLVDSSRTAD